MMTDHRSDKRRILVIDDNPAIHDDFRKVLAASSKRDDFDQVEAEFFGSEVRHEEPVRLDIVSAYQGEQALSLVIEAKEKGDAYQLAFVDLRMPPGWDGVETIERIWEVAPELEVVICSAYSDYTKEEIQKRLAGPGRLLSVLGKPFDSETVLSLARSDSGR